MDIELSKSISEIKEMISELYAFMQQIKQDHDNICGVIELDRVTLERLLGVSESTIYRWRTAKVVPYHLRSDHSTYYIYDEIYVALKRGLLNSKSFNRLEALQRMKMYKEGIIRGLLSPNTEDPELL